MFSLVGLIVAWQVFGFVWNPIFMLALRALHPGVTYVAA
jgi:hypothetical protein